MSSVLSLRGDDIVSQPIVNEASSSMFCWNGEAWSIDKLGISQNDTKVISQHLFEATQQGGDTESAVLDLLSRIQGPYAFVFFDAHASIVYFGRDNLGRRSLILQKFGQDNRELTVSSVVTSRTPSSPQEVDILSIHKIDLKREDLLVESLPSKLLLPPINKLPPADDLVLKDMPSPDTVTVLLDQLQASLRPRVEAIPTYTAYSNNQHPSRVAVLFSGGLDCTLLARALHDILPYDQPVDLLNVAFENPRVLEAEARSRNKSGLNASSDMNRYEGCPDRRTGRSSYQELVGVCHQRTWRFVSIDVSYDEFLQHQATVAELMHPHNTEMDLSICSALYFAARGKGLMTQSADWEMTQTYTTTARVLLSGLGADELFGGYGRHAAAFVRGGYDALNDELELDFNRIGTRNLGRDDRVIAHWGRETRYPFLDEQFIKFALGLPAWEKCGFRPSKTVPKHFDVSSTPDRLEDLPQEKMLLRCALWQLGIKGAASEKKRAIQFGARTAKMQSGRSKGTDVITMKSNTP